MLSRWRLRARLVLLMLVALVPVFGLFACSAAKNQQTMVTLAQASLQSQALLAAAHQQRLVERTAQLLGDIASGPLAKDTRNRLCVQYLRTLQSQNASYDNLGIVDLDGKLACHALDAGADLYIGDRAFYQQVLDGNKFLVGEYAVSRSSGRPGIAFGVPVHGADGLLNGVAFAALGIEKMAEALAADQLVNGVQLRVLDRRGIILAAHPPAPDLAGSQAPDAQMLDAMRAGQPGVREAADAAGVEQVYAYAPVAGTNGGLFVALSVPRAVLTAASRALLLAELSALLGMAAFGMACIWAMGKRMVVNPVNAILKEADEITRGNFLARVRLGSLHQGEIGKIALSFSRMAQSLQTRQEELDAASRQADAESAMLDLILNSLSEGVIAVDTEGRFLLFNAAARRIFSAPEAGASFDGWRQKNRLLTLDGKALGLCDEPLAQTLSGARIDNLDLLFASPGAQDRILRMSTWPLLGPDRCQVGALTVFHDVTARKAAESFAVAQERVLALERARAEAALISSEARFRELAEKIEDVFYSVDAPGGGSLRYISPGYEKIWGRSCESLYVIPGSHADAVLAEDRHMLKLADELNNAGQMSDVVYRILSTDGQMRWIRDRTYPVFNAAGELERLVGTARDITESKLAHVALASSNRALQMLSRSSIAVNRIHDEADLLAEVCRVAVDVGGYCMAWVGYARDDEHKTIEPVAHAGDERGYLTAIEVNCREDHVGGQGPAGQAIRSGKPQQKGDISCAGDLFWRDAALQRGYRSSIHLPLCNAQHNFGVLCLYAGEIQQFAPEEVQLLQELADNLAFGIVSLRAGLERSRSEEAARQAAARLHEQASLIDLAQDAIVVRNLDQTLRFWNKGAERLYGWSAEEVLGKTMDEVMCCTPKVLVAPFDRMVATDVDWTGELEQMASDGSVLFVEARSSVVRDAHGQVTGVMTVITDIRERQQAREEILQLNSSLEERVERRTAQLKFANQQLEAFSYSVSHDLRSPLSAVDGFSSLLEKSITRPGDAPLSDRSRHYLARIRAGVGQMGELIDAMLLLAQVSRTSLRGEPVDLGRQAEAVLLGFREREPGRAVQWQIEPGLLTQGDSRLLRQVLENLLGNAWKFTAGKARACIAVGQEKNNAGETVFFVRDDGAGFDMAHASKLFGAFQRLHDQAEFPGTGIGLATVQRIVARHSGRVWADAAPGQGATFYFTLGAAA